MTLRRGNVMGMRGMARPLDPLWERAARAVGALLYYGST
jgi:hypothetical protein